MLTGGQNINLQNGNWLTTLIDMKKLQQKEFCKSILKAKFFIFTQLDDITYSELLKKDEFLQSNKIKIKKYYTSFNAERVPILFCSFGELISLRLSHYSKHEGYILFSDSHKPVGVITKSYQYKEDTETMKDWIAEILSDDKTKRKYQYSDTLDSEHSELPLYSLDQNSDTLDSEHPELPLYSLDQFNQWKLCATLMYHTLERYVLLEDTFPERTRNILLSTKFEYMNNSKLSIKCLKCKFERNIQLYILQTPIIKDYVIVFRDNIKSFNLYKIIEFTPETSQKDSPASLT